MLIGGAVALLALPSPTSFSPLWQGGGINDADQAPARSPDGRACI